MKKLRLLSCIGVVASLISSPAWAHPGHVESANATAFITGLLHPLTGLDHVLAMVAVGLLAVRLGGRALWAVPASFVVAMIAGGTLPFAGVQLPMVEPAIASSVLVVGLLIAMQAKLPAASAALIVASFAVFHGYAHGAEMPVNASALQYALGFIAATAALHMTGMMAAMAANRSPSPHAHKALRVAGGLVAAAGVALTASSF
ncbi:HupE/UreJ family protein [Hyphomicrobium sp.]|uniref:HupE/UreJ family protein n=1 Tax=Hyphomicrobium sp. TaxID=82 RepID=UPI002D7A2C1A|nr:HupE/UreJ family protein [Hyphomicrobium sp.]HET6387821.1 HupE/UreJ family protein [Hyphomicrobium sp.]